MSEKLVVAGRKNWEGGFYLKFKAGEDSIKMIKSIVSELGAGDYFQDNQVIPKGTNFDKWKDQWIPIKSMKDKKLNADIIIGDKFIHMLVSNYSNLEELNEIIRKYSKWAEVKYREGFPKKPNE